MDEIVKLINELLEQEYDKGYADGSLSVRAEVNESEYNRGLEDAWEITRKLFSREEDGGMRAGLIKYIFDGKLFGVIELPINEVKDKIESYEAQKKEDYDIRVGDEIIHTNIGTKGICAKLVSDNQIYVLTNDVSCELRKKCYWKKTGRHVDLDKIFGEVE